MSWRKITNLVKHNPRALALADHLGRSRMRLRPFERLNPPPKPPHTPDLSHWTDYPLAACWIGHATVLLRLAGLTILTDPVFSNRVGIGIGPVTAGPRRLQAPALSLKQLPKIDLLLISHAHFDHLDRPTLHRLPKSIPVITAHHTKDLIHDLGFKNITELDWNQSTTFHSLHVAALPTAHWGARIFTDSHRGHNAYLLESTSPLPFSRPACGARPDHPDKTPPPPTHRVLYGGDSAYHEGLKDIPDSSRGVDLAILGIGAYDPYVAAHATPEQALAMADHCRAAHLLPMHHGTFRLGHEPQGEPLQRLRAAIDDPTRIVAPEPGALWISP